MRTGQGFAASALLAGREHAGEDAVKLFDREILAHVAIGPGAQSGVHPLLVISDAGENNDGKALAHLTDESDQ